MRLSAFLLLLVLSACYQGKLISELPPVEKRQMEMERALNSRQDLVFYYKSVGVDSDKIVKRSGAPTSVFKLNSGNKIFTYDFSHVKTSSFIFQGSGGGGSILLKCVLHYEIDSETRKVVDAKYSGNNCKIRELNRSLPALSDDNKEKIYQVYMTKKRAKEREDDIQFKKMESQESSEG